MDNYVAYHVHTELSLLDSATKFQDYIDAAVRYGHRAIAFTEHGNVYQWVQKKMACDKVGIKYIHGVECYLTEALEVADPKTGTLGKVRDNYHTVLLAKNYDGLLELNTLVGMATQPDHFYYKPRITFKEFLGISRNVIKISACLASPLNKLPVSHPMYEQLLRHYDYLEIQPHNCPEQISFNRHLAVMSQTYGIPLIAGTDTHSISKYKAECRSILQLAKHIEFANEDSFDLTFKSYDELVQMFASQNAIPEAMWMEAIENTNRMADSVEPFELDTGFKYPVLYGERDRAVFQETIDRGFKEKVESGAITQEQIEPFQAAILEECRVFDKIDMCGFMLFMSELATWCKSNDIPLGFNRGSCGGSRVAYVTDITDLNPETWHTVFSRFCNEDRKEIGDIDIDVPPSDRDRVYAYIINRFGQDKTAYILAIGTIKSKGCIDEICRALSVKWRKENLHNEKECRKAIEALKNGNVEFLDDSGSYSLDENGYLLLPKWMQRVSRADLIKRLSKEYTKCKEMNAAIAMRDPWNLAKAAEIKDTFGFNPEHARAKYPEVFYYYDGLLDVAISQSMHPAGIVASPITLADHYGTFLSDGKTILQIDMDCVHEAGLVKYDILGLKNIGLLRDVCKMAGIQYPKSHEINWDDQAVWTDMLRSPVGIFQFEGDFAFQMLKQYEPHSIFDMSLVTAALRPSGASYRNDLMKHKPHKNPSPMIDKLLEDNNGYLIYQEDVIKFLQEICGFTGSDADNTRRAIARKDEIRLQKAIPEILEGYCAKSAQPRSVAEQEAKEFLQVIQDASSYMFGYNHSIGYCMIGYLCAFLRYYHPKEFITAYLNNMDSEGDVKKGSDLARLYGVEIIPPKFGVSRGSYQCSRTANVIAKGIGSVKFMNETVAEELYALSESSHLETFVNLLHGVRSTSTNARQMDVLIKIGYFSDYGNPNELAKIRDAFMLFADKKRISKAAVPDSLCEIVEQYATDKLKSGGTASSYTILDLDGLLNEIEREVHRMHLPDVTYREKIKIQKAFLGYVDLTTHRLEDRRKLIVLKVVKRSWKGRVWGYIMDVRSIGTGKEARLTVHSQIYQDNPIREMDIIYASQIYKNNAGYWCLGDYYFADLERS